MTNDICRLIQVREKNATMIDDWILFLTMGNFAVTAGEIYNAYVLALSGELNDEDGRKFDLYPELSCATTSKIIHAYKAYKINDEKYEASLKMLKKLASDERKLNRAKKAANRSYEDFLRTDQMPELCVWIFDLLVYDNKIKFLRENAEVHQPMLFEYYKTKAQEAKIILEQEDKKDYGPINEITDKDVLNKILIGSKKIVLREYFEKQASEQAATIF